MDEGRVHFHPCTPSLPWILRPHRRDNSCEVEHCEEASASYNSFGQSVTFYSISKVQLIDALASSHR